MKQQSTNFLVILLAIASPLPAFTRPGILWKQRWNPLGNIPLTSIAANPAGEMVAVGGNAILHTTDGTLWSHTNKRGGLAFQDVTWSGTEWVVVGLNGTIMSSPDALTWTSHSLGGIGHRSLGAVVASPAVTAIPCNGLTAVSPQAGSWFTTPNNLAILDATPHDLHLFESPPTPVMVATVTRGGGIYTSENGTTWMHRRPAEPAEIFFAVGGNDSILVASALGSTDPGTGTRFYTSEDSVDWTRRFIPGFLAPFLDIIWTGSAFVACANDSNTSSPVIFTSPDGITWSHHTPPGPISRLCWNGSMIVGIDSYGSRHICANPAPDAPDDWISSPVSFARKNVWGLAHAEIDGTNWVVAVGDYGLIQTSQFRGNTFTLLAALTSARLRDIIATPITDHRFIAFGNELVITSPDAESWTIQSGPGVPDANGGDWFTPTLYPIDPGSVVAVGSLGRIHTSPDGIAWSARSSGTTADLNDVGSGLAIGPKPDFNATKRLVAVGAGGTILTSSSGASWTERSSGTTETLRDVCGLDQGFIAVGDAGTLLRSINGIDWSPANLPEPIDPSENLHSCCWTGSQAIVTGTNRVLSSPDGTNWTQLRTLVGTPYSVIPVVGDRLLAGGAGGIFSSDPALEYSDWASIVGIPASQDDPTDDPNGDGHDNLTAYAFEFDPLGTPDPAFLAHLPRLASSTPGEPVRLLLSPSQGLIGDLAYIIETSTTLAPGDWTEALRYRAGEYHPTGSLHFSETEDINEIQIEFPGQIGDSARFFTRLRLQQLTPP